MTTYNISLPQFEGPFDLLLFFIERDELDIHDIPVAKVTKDFLDYIKQMQAINIDVASEFIVVAANLLRIKSRMLVPRLKEEDELKEEDPRAELVNRLLEYKKYKEVLDELQRLEHERQLRLERGNALKEMKSIAQKALVDVELEQLTLFKLLQTYAGLLDKMKERERKSYHMVYRYAFTIRGQQQHIRQLFMSQETCTFEDIFDTCVDRIHAIITFLALLELLNKQQLRIIPGHGANNFYIKMPEPTAAAEEE